MRYYVNKNAQANGDHEVHQWNDCPTPADPVNRHNLGEYATCRGAVAAAKLIYPKADGCTNCSPDCHKS